MKEIAGFLHLSEKTVEFHKHHIMVAFNLKNNADLVLFALSQGLIAPDRTPLFIRPRELEKNPSIFSEVDERLGTFRTRS